MVWVKEGGVPFSSSEIIEEKELVREEEGEEEGGEEEAGSRATTSRMLVWRLVGQASKTGDWGAVPDSL